MPNDRVGLNWRLCVVMKKVITGWKLITASNIATYYNGSGDALYTKKLDFVLPLVRKVKASACVQ